MMIKKLQENKACPAKLKRSGGFVIIFAVTLSSILLAIALGVSNVALTEIKFSTSARSTNDAFFAADTAVEYILYQDKPSPGPGPIFVPSLGTSETREYVVSGLGGGEFSCAKISVEKDNTVPPATRTRIISKGYNVGDSSCISSNPDRIERELKISY